MNVPFAEVRETHSGVVFLYGDRAYKTKKPVKTPFLDFSSTAQRDAACIREIALNRRLAPDAYLGLGHLTSPERDPEPVVVMRRMPEDTKLSRRLDDTTAAKVINQLARMIARFHQTAQRSDVIDQDATPSAVLNRWQQNIAELGDLCPNPDDVALANQVGLLCDHYLRGRGVLLADRIRTRRIVDGHGDLLTDDIFCLPDGPRVLDCLDFDDRLRYVDGIDDAAFLAMDIEFHGHRALADEFLTAYRQAGNDDAPTSLIDHYIAYRAVVRAKVDMIRANQGVPTAHDDAHLHLRLAREHLLSGQVRLAIVGGLPGTGKTTVATALARSVDAVILSSDIVRRELVGAGVIAGAPGKYGEGLYSPANKAIVYGSMFEQAKTHLLMGRSVVLDGSWTDPEERRFAATVAADTSSVLVEMRCVVDKETADQRIAGRLHSPSDATPAIAHSMAEDVVDDRSWQGVAHIDTSKVLRDSVNEAARIWAAATIPVLAP
ncbi:bifunctional aminoglycoside phosphotransferase/ATP-binding protein [Williamsia sp. R60]